MVFILDNAVNIEMSNVSYYNYLFFVKCFDKQLTI